MKEYKFLNKVFALLLAPLVCLQLSAAAQNAKTNKKEQKIAEIQNLIQSKKFVFVAQYANPMRGRSINLTTLYDVKLSADTLTSELPYYGRAFVAPINPEDAGIFFTSTKFNYTVNPKKKGGWDIVVSPKDGRDVTQMYLAVSENGYASLQVTSNNRESINFTGYITARNKFK